MDATWRALAWEAALAAEHMGVGVTALGNTDYARHAFYSQAFFALTIGMERAAKLALVVDHALANNGMFPDTKMLRGYGHHLGKLLEKVDQIAENRKLSEPWTRYPRSTIHDSIVMVLSDFASNITRYYNLDFVTGDEKAQDRDDPIKAWHDGVTSAVLAAHYTPRQKWKHKEDAALIEGLLGNHALVRHHGETGEEINSLEDAAVQSAMRDAAKPWERLYVMQIVRFLAAVLCELGYAAHFVPLPGIPSFSDFFRLYMNEDKYLKGRKAWSIYRL